MVSGSVTTDVGVVTGTDPIAINLGTLLPGEVATVRFQVTIDGGVVGGTIITNQGTVTGNNFTAVQSDDNGNPNDGRNPTLTPVSDPDNPGPGPAQPGDLTKRLTASSEDASSDSDVLIGEVLTFAVSVDVPVGTLREATLIDTLPAGLSYVANTAQLSRTFDLGLTASQNPGGINSALSGVLTPLADNTELQQDGQDIRVFLGDVINSDSQPATYRLQFKAVVQNIAENYAGRSALSNSATLGYFNALNQPVQLSSVSAEVAVIEPDVTVSKEADPMTLLPGGGTVTYTVVLSNAEDAAPAYDARISDLIPDGWDLTEVVEINSTGGVQGLVDNSDLTTDQLAIDIDQLPAGASVTVTYRVQSPSDLAVGSRTPNTANAVWTSLPGARGTDDATPGNPGAADGERTGSGVGANDFNGSDSAEVLIGEPALSKTVLDEQSRYAIGDVVDYELRLSVPAGAALASAVLSDQLADGLTYISDSLSLELDGLTISNSPSDFTTATNEGGTLLTADVGTLRNPNSDSRKLVVRYQARVANQLSNQDGQGLANTAAFDFTDPGTGQPATPLTANDSVTVGEPRLTLEKTIVGNTADLDAGDSVTFEVTVGNDGTRTAYGVVLSDVLPAGLRDVASLTRDVDRSDVEPVLTPDGDTWSGSAFDLAVGEQLVVRFSATLADSVFPGQTLQNQIDAGFSSRPGDDPNQRDGSGDGLQGDDSVLDNYNAEARSPTVTVADPVQLDKRFHPDATDASYAIGETVTYRLRVALIEGTVDELTVIDQLPAGLQFLDAEVGLGNTGMATAQSIGPSDQPSTVNGQTLTFFLGQVDNPANAKSDDDFLTIDIRARVENIPANQNGRVLGNDAELSFLDADGLLVMRSYDADDNEAGIQPLELTIVEPALALSKTADRDTVSLGDEVGFTLRIDHSVASTADAFDLVIEDRLPVGLSYVPGSASPEPSVDGQTLRWARASLTQTEDSTTIDYSARVASAAAAGQELTNSANLTWASQPEATGAADSGRTGPLNPDDALNDYADAATFSVTPNLDAFLYPVKSVSLIGDLTNNGQVDPGDTLEYRVELTNQGAQTATGVVFTDAIPANTSYVDGSLTSTQGSVDDSTDPLMVDIGELASAATVTITFEVTVNAATPTGTVISNQGVVDSDQTVPTPTNRADIRVGGDLTAGDLYAEKMVAKFGGTGSTIGNGDTVQYSLTLQNTGGTTLTNARLTDTLPAGLTYVADSASTATGTLTVVDGEVTWIAGDLAVNASVTATFRATVSGVPDNSRRDFINQATVAYTDPDGKPQVTTTDSNASPEDGNQPTVFTAVNGAPPLLDVAKRWELVLDQNGNGLPSAHDRLRYSLTVTNTGTVDATDVRLTDVIPTNTNVVAGSVTTSQGAVVDSDPVSVNLGTLAASQTATISFQVTIGSGVPTGTVIQNHADVSATDLSATSNTTLTTVVNEDQRPAPVGKLVVAHSEPVTDASQALIGEVLTYQLAIRIPPGGTTQVQLLDTLPSGLRYLDGSARLARSAATLRSTTNPGGINDQPAYVEGNADDAFTDVSADVASDDQTLILALGDVANSDANQTATYTLQYQVLVLNVGGNVRGTKLSNAGTVSYWNALSQSQTATPIQTTVQVREASLVLGKTAGPSSLLPSGGTTTYTLTVTNQGDAPAYDVSVTDALPDVFTSASTSTGGCSVAGRNLTCDIDEIAPDTTVTLTFDATAGSISGSQITNSATATWTSLPGAHGTVPADETLGLTPGDPGDLDGERTGDTGVDFTGSNGYTTNANATIVVGTPGLTKSIDDPQAHYAIGEIVHYRVTASLPAGMSLNGARIIDTLPAGMSYVAGSASETVSVSGQLLTFDLGTLNVTTKTLTYQARVDNVLANQNNVPLTNGAQLIYTDPGTDKPQQTAIQSQTALVGEPRVALTLNVTPTTDLQAGDTVVYTIDLSNGGTATTAAHDIDLRDLLPDGLEGVPGTLSVSGTGGVGASVFVLDAAGLTTATPFTLPVGASIRLSFQARLTDLVTPGEQLFNDVTADFASLSGNDANARTGEGGSDQDDPATLDNYHVVAQAPVLTIGDTAALDKRFYPDSAGTRYAVGELVTYRLTLSLIEGRTDQVELTDTLPAGMLYESSSIGVGSLGMTHQFNDSGHGLTTTTDAEGRTILSFDLGTVINPADGQRDNDFLTVDLVARVANVAATNPAGATLGNHAQVSYQDGGGQTRTLVFDADPAEGIQPLNLIVVEPKLSIEKRTDATEPVMLDDELSYTLTVSHLSESTANAHDLVVTDTLPTGLSYVAQSGSPTPEIDGQTLTFRIPSLTLTQGRTTLTYGVRVNDAAPLGQSLVNQAGLRWASQPDATGDPDSGRTGDGDTNAEGGENDYLDSASATIPVAAQSVADVATTVTAPARADVGDEVEVNVTYANHGPTTADGLTYLLLLTPGLEGVTCEGVTCVYDPRDGRIRLTGLPDTLEAGESLSFVVRYTMPQAGPVEVWSEIATTALDVDASNNESQASTLTDADVGGQLQLVKTAYLSQDDGAGCPGSKQISVVNKYRVPVAMTWCFSATNLGETWLDAPVFTDEGLNVIPANQDGMRLRSGTLPLAPGATAVWYYEETRDISLLNYVELTMTPVESNGTLIPGADPAWGSDSIPAIFGYVFDPPFGVKNGRVDGQDLVRWTMVWVNDNVIRADNVSITDPPPVGMTMTGTPTCTAYGTTSVDLCGFDPPSASFPRGRVRVLANFGADFGVTLGTIGQAPNRLEIAFDVLVDRPEAEETYENQGESEWTPPEAEGETFVAETYDLTQLEGLDPDLPPSDIDPEDVPPSESPVTPSAQADLAVIKSVDRTRPIIGDTVTFTLTTSNQGPETATGVTVSDPLPRGYTYVSNNPSQGRYNAETGEWYIGTLAKGARVTLRIAGRVNATGPYTNTATVAGRESDPNAANNRGTVTPVPVTPPLPSNPIPTLSEWGMLVLSLMVLLSGLSMRGFRRR
nr:IPTL-CTERM sorting domain-containing protein [Thiorhodococcus mannitoliphagus]